MSRKLLISLGSLVVVTLGGVGAYAALNHNTPKDYDHKSASIMHKSADVPKSSQASTESSNKQTVSSLSNNEKVALALLGIPSGFSSDFGDLTTDSILSGKSNVTSNAIDTSNSDQKISSVDFSGIRIETDGIKNLVKLNNVSSNIDNISYVEGYFTIDGDTITYKNQGTRLSGEEQDQNAQQLGTQSLQDLLNKYNNDDKFKKMVSLVTYKNASNVSDSTATSSKASHNNPSFNMEQIKTGDFSTLAGTWKKADGSTVSINSDGTFTNSANSSTQKIDFSSAKDLNGYTQFNVTDYPVPAKIGGSMMLIIPANTEVNGLTTRSEDSILIGQNTMDALVFTKVN